MSLCYTLNFELKKESHSIEGIELQGFIVISLGRPNTDTCSVHSDEIQHLKKVGH